MFLGEFSLGVYKCYYNFICEYFESHSQFFLYLLVIFCSKHRVTMNVTKYQRKRLNENNQRIENNKELLSYPYLTVVRKTKIQGGVT
jgi:hypothetical protein